MSNQMSLWNDTPENDERPLPLITASKWNFALAYVDTNGNPDSYLYSVQDWLLGLGVSKSAVRKEWTWLKKQLSNSADNSNPQLSSSEEQLKIERTGYKASDGKTYQMDFTDAKGLYLIAQNMRPMDKRENMKGVLSEIYGYLAKAGAFVDAVRLNPEIGVDLAVSAYARQGKAQDWISERIDGKVSNQLFHTALVTAVAETLSQIDHATAQNDVYDGLWQRTAAQLKLQMGLKKHQSLRDNQPALALSYQRIAETVIREKLSKLDGVGFEEARNIVHGIASMIGSQAAQTARSLSVDLATGKPLLGARQ